MTTTGSRSARGLRGELNNLANPISAILTRPLSGPSPITRMLAGFYLKNELIRTFDNIENFNNLPDHDEESSWNASNECHPKFGIITI